MSAIKLLAQIALDSGELFTQQVVDKLTELLKAADTTIVNETIIALQTIINHGFLN